MFKHPQKEHRARNGIKTKRAEYYSCLHYFTYLQSLFKKENVSKSDRCILTGKTKFLK